MSPYRRMTTGAMACLADRTPAGRRLNGRRDAKICAREVLHYVDGCNKLPPIDIFRRHAAVRNPLHVTAANPHPCTFLSLSCRCSCHESLVPPLLLDIQRIGIDAASCGICFAVTLACNIKICRNIPNNTHLVLSNPPSPVFE